MTFCRLKEKSTTSRVKGLNLFKDLIENYGLGGSSSVTLRSYSKEVEGEASIYVIFGWGIRTVTHTYMYSQAFILVKKSLLVTQNTPLKVMILGLLGRLFPCIE